MVRGILLTVIPIALFILSCASYEAREVPVKTVQEYPNKSTISEVTIAVDSFDNPTKAESAFYVDTTEKDIRPILLIIENKSGQRYLIIRAEIRCKDRSGNTFVPVTSDHAYELFDINELLHSALFGIFGGLSAQEANEKMKADWNSKEIPEELILNPDSSKSGFVFFETEQAISGNLLIINAINLKTDEILNFELQIL